MDKKFFTKLLNLVGPDRSFKHLSTYGICALIYRIEGGKSIQFYASEEPDTNTAFGILCYFNPTPDDICQLRIECKDECYWGSDSNTEMYGILTDLRSTILCFCAAINNEL